jgi:hypothetical protein
LRGPTADRCDRPHNSRHHGERHQPQSADAIPGEDRQLELLEAGTWFEPELLGQRASELLVDLERFGLAQSD